MSIGQQGGELASLVSRLAYVVLVWPRSPDGESKQSATVATTRERAADGAASLRVPMARASYAHAHSTYTVASSKKEEIAILKNMSLRRPFLVGYVRNFQFLSNYRGKNRANTNGPTASRGRRARGRKERFRIEDD